MSLHRHSQGGRGSPRPVNHALPIERSWPDFLSQRYGRADLPLPSTGEGAGNRRKLR